jgi:hypothetical protein
MTTQMLAQVVVKNSRPTTSSVLNAARKLSARVFATLALYQVLEKELLRKTTIVLGDDCTAYVTMSTSLQNVACFVRKREWML